MQMETVQSPPPTSPLPPSAARLWRVAAQRNLRNQWSQLASLWKDWSSLSSRALSHANEALNYHLHQQYMPHKALGVLTDMPLIRTRASMKLHNRQVLATRGLLESYKAMVDILRKMFEASRLFRCFLKGSINSPLLQFSERSEQKGDSSDTGDGGGIPVYTFLSISSHEKYTEELVQMFSLELCMKRFLVLEFVSLGYDTSQVKQLSWSTELYAGEFKHLSDCNLYCEETHGPVLPRSRDGKSEMFALTFDNQHSSDVLEVYLTTWRAELNIDIFRVNEIFETVGEEMHIKLC
ncbi:hypothetical protein Ahy_B09g098558 [Arachis hypogaea]|uniref:Uncharacterized protein n=1 Tax=Arachis hypogaea TaxID=3818 RepID=A0A444XRI0_ARAHY|nr:hypothetical protein Ahy_B09g098558 [Arachis hypogaea]